MTFTEFIEAIAAWVALIVVGAVVSITVITVMK